MKTLKLAVVLLTAVCAVAVSFSRAARSQEAQQPESSVDRVRRERFRHNGTIEDEGPAGQAAVGDAGVSKSVGTAKGAGAARQTADVAATEALAGFDNQTNGYAPQGPDYATLDESNVVKGRSHNDDRFVFEEFESVEDGLGPTYNAQSCRECHENVVTGGASQVTVQRTGRTVNGEFFESLGGSLIHSRATYPDIVELVAPEDTTRTFRISPSTLGDGYVECIANNTLLAIRDSQPPPMRGTATMVPVLEGDGSARVGRFGWKSQHASLLSFSADAYLNEMGITSPFLPEENTSSGRFVGYGSAYDPKADPEDDGGDVRSFADFMRGTKAPSRGPVTADVLAGESVFRQIGCNVCHVESITTAQPGTVINGGAYRVPDALGGRVIHPYSDFLLHNIGTGDGIPILATPEYAATAYQMRTAPLWGLRTRSRLMHDGLTFTLGDAILRHRGQAAEVTRRYKGLFKSQRDQLFAFLGSL